MDSWVDEVLLVGDHIQRVIVNSSVSQWTWVTSVCGLMGPLGVVPYEHWEQVHLQQVCRHHQAEWCFTPEGEDTIQIDLDKLKEWTHGNLMKFHRVKCKVLHLCQGNPLYQCKRQDEGIDSSPAGSEDLVLVDERLDMSQQ